MKSTYFVGSKKLSTMATAYIKIRIGEMSDKNLFSIIKEVLKGFDMKLIDVKSFSGELMVSYNDLSGEIHYELSIIEGVDNKDLIIIKDVEGDVLSKASFVSQEGYRDLTSFEDSLAEAVYQSMNSPYKNIDVEISHLKGVIVSTVICEEVGAENIIDEISAMEDLVLKGVVSKQYMLDFLNFVLEAVVSMSIRSDIEFQMINKNNTVVGEFKCPCECYTKALLCGCRIKTKYL